MSKPIIRPEIHALRAYHVPASAGMIKLDSMENPHSLPMWLKHELSSLLLSSALNRYPDADGTELKYALRAAMKIPAEMDILIGNGSDEIIQIAALATATPGSVMLGVEPSFVMYPTVAIYAGMRYVGVPLQPDFTIAREPLLRAIAKHQPALTFFAYPNNPTGNLFDADTLRAAIKASPGLVIVDEAYFAYSHASFLSELGKHENLLVMRTVSKLGLAGIRLGFIAGARRWLQEFEKVRMPYNVNVMTQTVATHLLRNPSVLYQQVDNILAQREHLTQALQRIAGVSVFPSAANFVLLRVTDAAKVFDGLKGRGILIKNLHLSHPLLENCLRVTVGTQEENELLLTALQASL